MPFHIRIPSSVAVLRRAAPLNVAETVEYLGIPVGLLLRRITEGRAYNVALSSFLGERAVGQYLAIVAQILQWEEEPDGLILNPDWHKSIAALAATVGVFATFVQPDGHGTPTDAAHNALLMPVLLYAGLSTAPAVLKTKNRKLQVAAIANLVAWTAYVLYDIETGRLKQDRFLREHGLW